MKNNLMIR